VEVQMAKPKADYLDVIEAAYDMDAADEQWLERVARKVLPHLDDGFGVAAFEFFRPPNGAPSILGRCHLQVPGALAAAYPVVFATMDPEIRERPFRMGPCVTGSQMMGMREEFREQPHMKKFAHHFGLYDSYWITAAEPSGHGCGFHAGQRKICRASPTQQKRWGQVAGHLANAVRLRRRLRSSAQSARIPDAVFDSSGKVLHAEPAAASEEALQQLRQAVLMLERSRGPLRQSDPDQSLEEWKALVAGRWSLLDKLEHDGRRYIVARENEPAAPGPQLLTPRERQVLAYASLGHHNKLIAYELGIAHSTVRVLRARAAAKLGTRSY
jgi:DNA-binding CsgD family transcriptional regulator